jgi:stress response protein SCP2
MSDQLFSLSAGQNASAPSGPWDVGLQVWPGLGIDVCALLVGEDGKVAGDDDFVFYNAPCHASGAVTLSGEPSSVGLRKPVHVTIIIDSVSE